MVRYPTCLVTQALALWELAYQRWYAEHGAAWLQRQEIHPRRRGQSRAQASVRAEAAAAEVVAAEWKEETAAAMATWGRDRHTEYLAWLSARVAAHEAACDGDTPRACAGAISVDGAAREVSSWRQKEEAVVARWQRSVNGRREAWAQGEYNRAATWRSAFISRPREASASPGRDVATPRTPATTTAPPTRSPKPPPSRHKPLLAAHRLPILHQATRQFIAER